MMNKVRTHLVLKSFSLSFIKSNEGHGPLKTIGSLHPNHFPIGSLLNSLSDSKGKTNSTIRSVRKKEGKEDLCQKLVVMLWISGLVKSFHAEYMSASFLFFIV